MKSLALAVALSLALVAPLALVHPVAAATTIEDSARAQKLDQLFRDLKAAKSESEGLAIENQIVSIWMASGDPKIDQAMEWAVDAMDLGAFDLALNYLNNIVVTKPTYVEGWNKRATLYYVIGHYQESLSDIAETLKLEPRHFGAIAGKGMVMMRLGETQKAIDAFKEALAIDPQLTQIQLQVFLLEDMLKGKRI
jgi:tetratricopeptide (TPR) repeat protein